MRILFLTQYFPPEIGAAQTRLGSITRSLSELGHDVRIITARPNYPTGRIFNSFRTLLPLREQTDHGRIYRHWIIPVQSGGLKRLVCYFSFMLFSFPNMVRQALLWRPELIFVESPPLFLGLSGVTAQKLSGGRLVFNVADLWPDVAADIGVISRQSLMYKLAIQLEAFIYRRADAVNIVVDHMREALETKGVPKAKIKYLPNGVDLDMFQPRPDAAPELKSVLAQTLQSTHQGKKILLYAGTHGLVHRLETILDAARILGEGRDDLAFVFVGDGAEKPSVMHYARQLRLQNVFFYDSVPLPEVADLEAITDIALSNSVVSARPAKIFPALACKVPLVYGGDGEGAALIQQHDAGLVVDPRDSKAFAKAIEAVLENPDAARARADNGRRLVEAQFDWQKISRQWLEQLAD